MGERGNAIVFQCRDILSPFSLLHTYCAFHSLSLLRRTKFVDDQWMVCEGLMDVEVPAGAGWWWSQPLSVLPLLPVITVKEQVGLLTAISLHPQLSEAVQFFHSRAFMEKCLYTYI